MKTRGAAYADTLEKAVRKKPCIFQNPKWFRGVNYVIRKQPGLDTVPDTTQEFFTVSGFGRGDGSI